MPITLKPILVIFDPRYILPETFIGDGPVWTLMDDHSFDAVFIQSMMLPETGPVRVISLDNLPPADLEEIRALIVQAGGMRSGVAKEAAKEPGWFLDGE